MRRYSLGAIYAVPAGTNPTPVPIADLKDATVTFKQAKKKFNGNKRVAYEVADGALDIGIKIKNANFRASALQLVMPQAVTTTGGLDAAFAEPAVIAASVTVSQSALFVEDATVLNLNTGNWMKRVTSAPTTGQYAVTAGVYTFAAADIGQNVSIAYTYSVAAGAVKTTLSNSIQSQSTAYKLRLYDRFAVNGVPKLAGHDFYSVHFEGLSIATKTEDFAEQDLDGFATEDMLTFTGKVMDFWSAD